METLVSVNQIFVFDFAFSAICGCFNSEHFDFLSPYPLTKKFKAGNAHMTMFVGGIRFAVGSLVAFPVIYGLFFAVESYFWNWWCSLLHLICLPSLGLFAWTYRKFFIGLKREWRFHVRSKRSEHEKRGQGLKETINLRKTLFEKLDKILSKKVWRKGN